MKKKVSVEQVARHAGVSKSTVSFVLNNKGNVASPTKERVEAALKELGYEKEDHSSPLTPLERVRTESPIPIPGEKKNILIYVNPSVREYEVVNTYMAGLREYALKEGQVAYSFAMSTSELESSVQLQFLEQAAQPQAILLIGINTNHPFLRQAIETGKPCLVINRINDDPNLSYVSVNHYETGRDAARYLVSLGHRHFALVVEDFYNESEISRVEGFLEELACQEPSSIRVALVKNYQATNPPETFRATRLADFLTGERLEFNGETILNIPSDLAVIRAKAQLDETFKPTCLVTANDRVAAMTQTGLQEAGLVVPRDVSVMSLNSSSASLKVNPQITAIDGLWYDLGYLAGRILENLIENKIIRCQKVQIRHRLIERGSTARPWQGA
jgi:LacI family transcriptional regulator